ncbi:MAG TPA: iron-containing alcohol dehydrogenase [Candidatus Cloacimonadota bacterium]|nr:iron-containing alcohol dehydrogenase [Candidatus Cloacimonadota bacterium]
MFYLPTKIVFKIEAVKLAALQIQSFGKKPLIVTGASSAIASGAQQDVKALFADYQIYAEIKENPELDSIMRGAEVFTQSGCDFIIGIGGGSPLDAAKAISVAAANQLNLDQLYSTELFQKAYPIVAIPTTSGTGSEVTQFSVLNDNRSGKKAGWGHPLAFPRLAIVDPRYTLSLSAEVTKNTAIDALSHLLEGLYSANREPLCFPMIHKGMSLIIKNLPRTLKDPSNLEARCALSQASIYGGMTISQGSTSLQHSIGYPLTTVFKVPHGLANGIVMKQIMKLYKPAVHGLLEEAFGSFHFSIEDFFAWLDDLNLNADVQITEEFITQRVPEVMSSRNMLNNPLEVTAEQIADIFLSLT